MSKQEIYEYIQKNRFRIAALNGGGGLNNLKHLDIYKDINYNFKNEEDLYLYLKEIDKRDLKCRLINCNNKKRFISFSLGYRDFCSDKCRNEWLSVSRKGSGNPIHRISDENRKKWGEKLSQNKKELIKNGIWTPAVTNSWCHSRYNLTFVRNNEIVKQKVRSSWEAFFQLINTNLIYEKLRIPYYYNTWHTYIVDFIDEKNKLVYEIKPKEILKKNINIIKENALIKWCKDNGYVYIRINEEYFSKLNWNEYEDTFKSSILEYDKIKKFKFYFKDEN